MHHRPSCEDRWDLYTVGNSFGICSHRKLTFREKQEWEGMEAAIGAAEAELANRQAAVERAATAGHLALAEACQALEDAQRAVEQLYNRWQELESLQET